jgi:hypothetical protein
MRFPAAQLVRKVFHDLMTLLAASTFAAHCPRALSGFAGYCETPQTAVTVSSASGRSLLQSFAATLAARAEV